MGTQPSCNGHVDEQLFVKLPRCYEHDAGMPENGINGSSMSNGFPIHGGMPKGWDGNGRRTHGAYPSTRCHHVSHEHQQLCVWLISTSCRQDPVFCRLSSMMYDSKRKCCHRLYCNSSIRSATFERLLHVSPSANRTIGSTGPSRFLGNIFIRENHTKNKLGEGTCWCRHASENRAERDNVVHEISLLSFNQKRIKQYIYFKKKLIVKN